MGFRAIAVKPENAHILKKELDLTVMVEGGGPRYLVDGFEGPVSYMILMVEDFRKEWQFHMGRELNGRFTRVRRRKLSKKE